MSYGLYSDFACFAFLYTDVSLVLHSERSLFSLGRASLLLGMKSLGMYACGAEPLAGWSTVVCPLLA